MRCALSIEENKPLYQQEIKAWSEMQSTKESPAYKESEIKSKEEQEFFSGYKFALDNIYAALNSLLHEEVINSEQIEYIKNYMSGDLCMLLFSILDNQEENCS